MIYRIKNLESIIKCVVKNYRITKTKVGPIIKKKKKINVV